MDPDTVFIFKPGGVALISDYRRTAEYAAAFRKAGLTVTRTAPDFLHTFPPMRIVRATKAGEAGLPLAGGTPG